MDVCFDLFLVCLYNCVCEYPLQNNSQPHWSVRGPLRECRSIRSGASGLPCYYAPLVCASAVLESLAVWWHTKPKNKNSYHERSKDYYFKIECEPTTRTYHDAYKHVTWIVGVPSSRATSGFPQYCVSTCVHFYCTRHASLWILREKKKLRLFPCVITPRGFASLPTQEANSEYSFPGFIPTNKWKKKIEGWRNRTPDATNFSFTGLLVFLQY